MLTLSTILGGILAWSLAEYAIHNGYGHLARGRNHFSREHLRHHAEFGYFSPTRQKILAAIGTTALVLPIALLLLGSYYGPLFTLSFVGMYLLYEWTHYRAHVVPPTGPYSRWVRRNHFAHHFTNAKLNHGVTSPIWDWVFRTWAAPGVIRVPRKHAMIWLLDSHGNVRREFAADYELRDGRRPTARTA